MSQILGHHDAGVDGVPVGDGPVETTEERRVELVRRLLERGVPVRALEALLPGWERAIEVAAFEA